MIARLSLLRHLLRQALPPATLERLRYLRGDYACHSYAQEGEDLILRRIFERRPKGFYVDVGAHHPWRFSNTYLFYRMGWRGINIDATPGSMKLFRKYRPRDINLEIAISDQNGSVTLYLFDEPALNSTNCQAMRAALEHGYMLVAQPTVPCRRLDDVLGEYAAHFDRIDFLTVDVEGADLDVLRSNDWQRFRPLVVLVEERDTSLEEVLNTPLYSFMSAQGYRLLAKTFNTVFFTDASLVLRDSSFVLSRLTLSPLQTWDRKG
jgi:FkbM family methyltransferase